MPILDIKPTTKYKLLLVIAKQQAAAPHLADKAISFFNSNNMAHIISPDAPGARTTFAWEDLNADQKEAIQNYNDNDFLRPAIEFIEMKSALRKTASRKEKLQKILNQTTRVKSPQADRFLDPEGLSPSSLVGREIRLAEDGKVYTVDRFNDEKRGSVFSMPPPPL